MNASVGPPVAGLSVPHVGALLWLSVAGVAGNAVLLAAMAGTPALRTATRAVFTVLLALSDLAVCLTAVPLTATALLPGCLPPARWACDVAGCTYVFFRWASLLAVSLVSADRCLAIRAPLRYPELLTAGRTAAAAGGAVLAAALLALLPVAGVGRYEFEPGRGLCAPAYYGSLALTLTLLVGAACLPLGLTLGAYGAVAEVALRAAKRGHVVCDENNCSHVVSLKAEMKPVQTLFTITGVNAVCWVPYITVNLWSLAWARRPSPPVEALTECLLLLGSATNPVMYIMLDRALRTAVSALTARARSRCCHRATHTAQPHRPTRTPEGGTELQSISTS